MRSSPQVALVWVWAMDTTTSGSTASTFGLRRKASTSVAVSRPAKPFMAR